MTDIHICAPRAILCRVVQFCHTCKRRRRFVFWEYAYYGPRGNCCACGAEYGDGHRTTRSKRRLTEYAAKARGLWSKAMPRRDALKALMAEYDS